MKKSERVELVMNAIKQSGHSYNVLDEKNGAPVHVRVFIAGKNIDVWPSSGTFGSGGVFIRNDVAAFVRAIGADMLQNAKTNAQRITELEEYCAHLEHEINMLKERL